MTVVRRCCVMTVVRGTRWTYTVSSTVLHAVVGMIGSRIVGSSRRWGPTQARIMMDCLLRQTNIRVVIRVVGRMAGRPVRGGQRDRSIRSI